MTPRATLRALALPDSAEDGSGVAGLILGVVL
jgi:hypothetical protein